MPDNNCENRLLSLLSSQEWHLDRLYAEYARQFGSIFREFKGNKFKYQQRELEKALSNFNSDVEKIFSEQIENAFGISDLCNDEFGEKYLKNLDISSDQKAKFLNRNSNAVASFLSRKEGGLSLSQRVWNLTQQTEASLNNALESGIFNGRPAADMARDLKRYLKEPDQRFRRVRNAEGKLILSNPAKDYHPGRGVYRSSYKNALRLSRNEINIAYRTNDFERRKKMPFVMGQRIRLSAAHPRYDICFTAWNTKITTSKGIKYIKDIQIGDLALTHNGRFRKVTRLFKSTCYETPKTELSYKVPYDNRSKTKKISATSNHPFLVNGEWKPLSEVQEGDMIKILAVRCKICDKKIPHYREYCSKACSSKNTAVNQWKSDEHRKNVSDKRKALIEENGGVIPYLKDWINSGENVKNILSDSAIAKRKPKLKAISDAKMKAGTHQFQQPENIKKSAKVQGNSHNRSFIEKKVKWLLEKLNINHNPQQVIYRKNAFRPSGQRRYYIPDFVLTDYNVIIECDGDYWHKGREKEDAERQAELEAMGYVVLRFPGSQIREDLKSVSEEIQRVVYNHEGKYEFLEYPVSNVRHYIQKQKTPITKWNFEVEEDNSYIANGVVVHNCDELVGTYPKDFKFVGWHPNCLCISESLLLPKSKFKEYLAGGSIDQRHLIKNVPKNALDYLNDNAEKIKGWKNKPYFLRDNFKITKSGLITPNENIQG